ncbi:energy transducer TonB [Noviherbaspirillum aerium]|uniref:energy transducer TonB n=1 Tax=Noviherbaspirillum aerium TaxID=2588497 RepID=UPI00124D8196|nr:energy transducer TonB [Noviherbaspirillum aerium]
MTAATAIIPAVAALLLHAGLALVAANMLSSKATPREPPRPIEVALIPEQPPAMPAQPVPPSPTIPPAPPLPSPALQPPVPAAPPVERKKPPPKPRIERKPAPAPRPDAPAKPPAAQPEDSSAAPGSDIATPRSAPGPDPSPPAAAAAAAPPSPPRTPVSIPASYAATNRKPEYPRLSRQLEEQGTVVLRVLVRADGTAGTVEIRTSSGFPLLDQSARNAVQTWRFNPATSDGKPVDEWFLIPIPFKLQN